MRSSPRSSKVRTTAAQTCLVLRKPAWYCANLPGIDYLERTRCVHYDELDASSVRGTRWCRFEPNETEEERLDELLGEIEEKFGGTDD